MNDYETLRRRTGIVIPVCFPAGVDLQRGEAALRETIKDCCNAVEDRSAICLSVDGEACGGATGRRLAQALGTSVQVSSENHGKFHAVQAGVRLLIPKTMLAGFAVIDQDGDHFANELMNFVRAAAHIAETARTDRVMILGRRGSRHRPMGFARGEFEELADRMLLDALAYHAARTNAPLRLEYAGIQDEFPDFHSGYKLFSRTCAEDVFLSAPELAGCPEVCYYRHAAEAVMATEAIVRGAVMGVVSRSTLVAQSVSTFGLLERTRLVADKIIWPCKRLEIPLPFVRQWLANHIPRLLLGTLAPEGGNEIETVRRLVLEAYGTQSDPGQQSRRPLFL
jgi:hypothetical protein